MFSHHSMGLMQTLRRSEWLRSSSFKLTLSVVWWKAFLPNPMMEQQHIRKEAVCLLLAWQQRRCLPEMMLLISAPCLHAEGVKKTDMSRASVAALHNLHSEYRFINNALEKSGWIFNHWFSELCKIVQLYAGVLLPLHSVQCVMCVSVFVNLRAAVDLVIVNTWCVMIRVSCIIDEPSVKSLRKLWRLVLMEKNVYNPTSK